MLRCLLSPEGLGSGLLFLFSPEVSAEGLTALIVSSALMYFSALSRSSVIVDGGFLERDTLKVWLRVL